MEMKVKRPKMHIKLRYVYMIMRELDANCGVNITDMVDFEVEDGVNNYLAYCESSTIDAESYRLNLLKAIEDGNEREEVEQGLRDMANKIVENDIHEFHKPSKFVFSQHAFFLPFDEFEELVKHEYAHALIDLKCLFETRQAEEDAHGEEFQYTVKQLGGKLTKAYVEQCDLDVRVFSRAKEMCKQYNKPYTVHYVRRYISLDGTIKYRDCGTARRKYNCKFIRNAVDIAKERIEYESEYEVSKVSSTYAVDNEQFIVIDVIKKGKMLDEIK